MDILLNLLAKIRLLCLVMKQGERSVTNNYTDSKILWKELEFLRLISVCTCDIKCNSNLVMIITKYIESKHVV